MRLNRIRCPHPQECGQQRHWSYTQRLRCEDLDFDAAIREQQERDRVRADEAAARRSAQWAEVVAAAGRDQHPIEPTDPTEKAVRDNGERQLLQLTPWQLNVIGHLTSGGIGRVNRALRSGVALDEDCQADLDWAGYTSNRHFADTATRVLASLEAELDLTEPITLYRGMILAPDTPPETIFGIRDDHTGHFVDPGFLFATLTLETARFYTSADAWWALDAGRADARPVVLELHTRRGLCLPAPQHRSAALASHLARTRELDASEYDDPARAFQTGIERADGQVIVPAGSTWSVLRRDEQNYRLTQI